MCSEFKGKRDADYDVGIHLYPEKKIPTISAKESALIPLARYKIYKC